MCGILGFAISRDSLFNRDNTQALMSRFFTFSESRGKDASGVALADPKRVFVLKRPVRAGTLIRSREYDSMFGSFRTLWRSSGRGPFVAMGHARMVTNGTADRHENNQPVIKDGLLGFHNGIVVNDGCLWSEFPTLERHYEVDTEIILSLVAYYRKEGHSLTDAVVETFRHLQGANSIALLAEDINALILVTTNGSLYYTRSLSGGEFLYASERYFLERMIKVPLVKQDIYKVSPIIQVAPGQGIAVSLDTLQVQPFSLASMNDRPPDFPALSTLRVIHDLKPPFAEGQSTTHHKVSAAKKILLESEGTLSIDRKAIAALRRCSRCVLPETFPFIRFDDEGVCSYCRNYLSRVLKGEDALRNLIQPFRKESGEPDCIVAVSGGRDSSYGLHYVKKELGMNPVAYTYDWGMVTDLARRNISRICGKLGIEHILISADIRKKRENIRKNVLAWLKKPDLGTVPIFMAGDKQFFFYASMLRRQMRIPLIFFNMNPMERTDFKTAFTGINENGAKDVFWNLSPLNKVKLGLYYSKQFLRNPAYLNASLFDTFFAFVSYYLLPKDFHVLYDYIRWDEKRLEEVLVREYGWERAADIETTWRIGDGTASFYNYIYYRVAQTRIHHMVLRDHQH
ncbi:MAG: hypothetical protein NTV99_12180 [Deltaproteobacteria bacterium]|nr:hypothetical protein [Deltaproteobacteria bacterium]